MSISIRTDIRPGDIGAMVRMHGLLYHAEKGWDWTFDAYVAGTLAQFAEHYNPETDRLWIAERDGSMIGTIAIIAAPENQAQLRWFLVHPSARGTGLGRRLLQEALDFCRSTRRRAVFLYTTEGLDAAAHLYATAGFRLVERKQRRMWGAVVVEEWHELRLTP